MEKEVFKNELIKHNIIDIKCKDCDDVIYYYDSKINDSGVISGKSFRSNKLLNDKLVYLCVCQECLGIKYPEYLTKNKGRVFNVFSDITAYAYNVSIREASEYRKFFYSQTEENMIRRYGEIEGEIKWCEYKERQSLSNKFEYKQKRHGWSKEQYNEYNANRACTLENLVKRHGEILGTNMWISYLDEQRYTKSKEYVVNKYGLDHWESICKSKSHNMENYIERYGELAEQKFEEFWNSISVKSMVSRSSQSYISKIDKVIGKEYKTYYFEKDGKEYGKNLGNRWVFLDYFISDINLCIEYNGDLYHANPKHYKSDDEPIPFNNIKASEIWKKDDEKIKLLKEKFNINVITVWESDLPTIDVIVNKIREYDKRQ